MVTNANRVEYTILVSKYRLDRDAMNKVCNAFRAGILSVIQEQWLKMFNAEELQMLISGAGSGGLDLDDMQRHVQYAGGYHPEHPVIVHLWKVRLATVALDQPHVTHMERYFRCVAVSVVF
jgi:ubiquitin-protein ligase E3 C